MLYVQEQEVEHSNGPIVKVGLVAIILSALLIIDVAAKDDKKVLSLP